MKLALAQYPVGAPSDFMAWRRHTAAWVRAAAQADARLLVFPEYASMELVHLFPESVRKDLQGQVRALGALLPDVQNVWADLARQYQTVIVAPSFPVYSGERVVNRVYVYSPQGPAGYQDKLLMTRFEAEEWMVDSPEAPELTLFESDWGHWGIQICYDVEFPSGSRVLARHGADLIVAPSCTETLRGASRVHTGARARALETQSYTAVSPLVGMAPWSPAVDLNFGFAAVYAPPDIGFPEEGQLSVLSPDATGWLYQELDFEAIAVVRKEGQVLNYRDLATEANLFGQVIERVPVKKVRC